jgi:Ca2+-binding RTX toxin-like protein
MYLPTLRGFGTLPALHIAMSQDEDLLDMVEEFALSWTTDAFADQATLHSDIEDILFTWAGVDGVATDSRGPNIDARRLEFMEELFGKEWTQDAGDSYPTNAAGEELEEAWYKVLAAFRELLVFQSGGHELFAADTTYNAWSGEIEGSKDLVEDAIDDLVAPSTAMGVDTEEYWINVAWFLDDVKGLSNLTGTEEGWLDTAIQAADNTLSWSAIESAYIASLTDPSGNTYSGTTGNDTQTGTIYDDTFNMNDGNDTVYGDLGNDEIHGDDGNDILHGEGGNDELEGSDGTDELYGGAGNDLLIGGADNDLLNGGEGGDTVYGGNGDDTYLYTSGDDVYDESGASGTDTILLPSGITLQDIGFYRIEPDSTGDSSLFIIVDDLGTIETPFFTNDVNILVNRIEELEFANSTTFALNSLTELTTYGTAGDDVINGVQSWEDTIFGLEGDDELFGQGGNDVLDGGEGNDELQGWSGDDTYVVSAGFDEYIEQSGFDTIQMPDGITVNDISLVRNAGAPNDLFISIPNVGQINISSQFGGFSGPIIEQILFSGQSPLDLTTLQIRSIGTSGNDTIDGIHNSIGNDNDIIDGREGTDTLNGQAGNDLLSGGAGNDTMDGGDGTDTADYSTAAAGVTVSLAAGTATGEGSDTLSNIENVTGSGFADTLTGNSSANVLTGGAGNDTLTGGAGGDTLSGGTGTDTADYTGSASAVNIDLQNATASGGDAASDTLTGIENVTGSNTAADIIYGDANANSINGLGGNDFLEGGAGADSIDGGAGWDTVRYTRSTSGVTVNLATNVNTGGDAANDLLYNIEALVGSNYNDTLTGGSGNDTLQGGAGDDALTGGAGDDIMDGGTGTGNDTLTGGDGSDTASYALASSGVTVSLAAGTATGQGSDTLATIEHVTGSAYADTLTGDSNANTLTGGAGNDQIGGGAGADTLYGQGDADTFLFLAASAYGAIDTIKDFSTGQSDKLDLSDLLSAYNPLDPITDYVEITTSGSNSILKVDANGSAGGASFVQIATLEGITGLTDEAGLVANGTLIIA